MLYVISYKLFTGIAIYLIITSISKILKTPIIYKHAGKVPMNKIPAPSVNVCPSHLYPVELLIDTKFLYNEARGRGSAIDSFGRKWNYSQAAKLYFYVFKRCQSAKSHSRYLGFMKDEEYLENEPSINNISLWDNPNDSDFKEILGFLKKYKATINCSEILAACRWGPDGVRNCSEIFKVEETGETGTCCRLTLLPSANELWKRSFVKINVKKALKLIMEK